MRQATQAPKIHFVISLIRWVGLTLLAMLVWHMVLNDKIIFQQENNAQLSAFIKKKNIEIDIFEKRQKTLTDFLFRLNFIAGLQQQNAQTAQLLDELSKATPALVTLTQLKRQGKEILVAGAAPSDLELIQLMENIGKSPVFLQPIIIALSTQQQIRHFQLKTWIKP